MGSPSKKEREKEGGRKTGRKEKRMREKKEKRTRGRWVGNKRVVLEKCKVGT